MVIIAVFLMVAAGNCPADQSKRQRIGFVPMTLDNEYFVIMVNAAYQAARDIDAELIVRSGSSHRSGKAQEQIIEDLIADGVDAICIVPSYESVVLKLKTAQDRGIQIVNIDTRLNPALLKRSQLSPIPYVGTNNYDGARKAGMYAASHFNLNGMSLGILIGIVQQENAIARWKGFKSEVLKHGPANVHECQANWEKQAGYKAVSDLLIQDPGLDLIFACNDNMALGAIQAITTTRRSDIRVIGYDGITPALDAVESGIMLATIAQMPAEMGIKGVQIAAKMIQGAKVPPTTYTGTTIVDKSNVAQFKAYLNQYRTPGTAPSSGRQI